MTNKIVYLSMLSGFFAASAQSHDVWLMAHHAEKRVVAEIGYGHNFPQRGELPGRAAYFSLPQLTDGTHITPLKATSEDYVYTTDDSVADGVSLVTVNMKPTFWSSTTRGWKPGDKKTLTDVKQCEYATKFAKTLITGGATEVPDALYKPVGQALELVPVTNPLVINAKKTVQFQVIYHGKPLANALVELNSARYVAQHTGYHQGHGGREEHHEAQAEFSATSSGKGFVTFRINDKGPWLARVRHKQPFADKTQCDSIMDVATFSFTQQ